MDFVITEIIVLFIIAGLFLILSGVWPPDSPWAPWWQMPDDVIRKMCKAAKISKKDKIFDLGCGTGRALCISASEFGVKGIGVEIDPLRVLIAKFNIRRFGVRQKVEILKRNFFDVDISDASVIFVYLVPKALSALSKKFFNQLKPGTILVTYIYDFPKRAYKGKIKLIEHDSVSKFYIYKLLG